MSTAPAQSSPSDYVTFTIDDQLFGFPIGRVQDVFVPERLTRVPLAPPEVAGILNLRGRIVTAIDMRVRLDLPPRPQGHTLMALGIEQKGEHYGLLVDGVGEVMSFDAEACEAKPVNMDVRLARVSSGVVRLDGTLLVILDVDRILEQSGTAVAA